MHYLKAGSGPPVILLHGGASDSQDWVAAMVALSHRYSLYAPDLIGFGRSDRLKSGYYLSDFIQFTLGFIKELGLDSPALVGHSLGGRLCLQVALRYPAMVRRLVLVDTAGFGKMSRWGGSLLALLWVMRKLFGRSQPYPEFLPDDGEEADWLCLERLADLTVPTLIVWKRHDPYLPLASARRAEELIPNVRLAVLPGYGHAPHKQNEGSFNRLLLDFLDHD